MDQADKNILERALFGVEILERDTNVAQPPQQRRNARRLGLAVELIDELMPLAAQRQIPLRKLRGQRIERFGQIER